MRENLQIQGRPEVQGSNVASRITTAYKQRMSFPAYDSYIEERAKFYRNLAKGGQLDRAEYRRLFKGEPKDPRFILFNSPQEFAGLVANLRRFRINGKVHGFTDDVLGDFARRETAHFKKARELGLQASVGCLFSDDSHGNMAITPVTNFGDLPEKMTGQEFFGAVNQVISTLEPENLSQFDKALLRAQ